MASQHVFSLHAQDHSDGICVDVLSVQVEAAYDILLMQSLSKRRAGKVADNSVRFADVKKVRTSSTPKWLQGAVSMSPVAVDVPASSDLAKQAAVFGALAAWTLLGAAGDFQPTSSGADVPGLQLALGFGASIYFLRQQKVKLGNDTLVDKRQTTNYMHATVVAIYPGCQMGW